MVALLTSLKLTLLRNGWRTSLGQRIGIVVGLLFGLSAAAGGAAAVMALRLADAEWAAVGVVLGGSLLALGWTVVPLLLSGVDETLDPARFALLPVRARELAPGLLLTGLIGVPGVVTSLLALATLVTWSRGVLPLLLAVPAVVLGTLTCVLLSRLVTTAAARLLAGRRSREVGTVVLVLLMSSAGLWPTLLAERTFSLDALNPSVQALGWTPFGLAWAGPADAATGHVLRGVLRLVLAALVVVVGTWAWAALLDRALVEQTTGGGTRARVGGSPVDRLPATPLWAVVARSLRYWRRDPRYLVALVGLFAGALVPIVVIQAQPGAHVILLGVGPLVGSLLGLVIANDLGTDGSAFAAHLLVGVPGLVDRVGRVIAVLLWGLPTVILLSVVGALLSGRPELWPGSLGGALGGLGAGLGASSIAAALTPYPTPPAGTNPFRTNSGGNARSSLAQLAVMSVTGTASLPAVALLVLAAISWPPAAWIGLVVGTVIGAGVLVLGVVIGGRLLDARGPEILAIVRKQL